MDETSLSKFGWKCDMFLLVHNQNKSLDGIKHTQCSDSYLFVIDHGFICPVLYRLFCLTKCLVALLWSRHLTMYKVSFLSSILIYTDMVYFKYIYGINKYEKRYLLVVLNLYGDILWESQWNGSLVMRSVLDFVCENVASHACIALI